MYNLVSIEDLYKINKLLIEKYGGCGVGFKDENLAISSIESCNQEMFGKVLYSTLLSKINHLAYCIVANHIFLDANKRTGSFIINILTLKYHIKLNMDTEYYIMKIATSSFSEKQALNYLLENSKSTKQMHLF